jgi:peptidoglycan/xylan/chitin deacetylase (PgdA/CDA1 family)
MGERSSRTARVAVAAALMVGLVSTAAPMASADDPPPPPPPPPPPLCVPGAPPIKGLATTLKVVTFTFDDGPSPKHTRPIMDAFEARGLRATFFTLPSTRNADLLAEIAARGHEVANHSRTHRYTQKSNVKEMPIASQLIADATGQAPLFYRVPGLFWSKGVVRATGQHGLCAIDTNIILGDWTTPRVSASRLCARFMKGLKPGSLVILHDGGTTHTQTVLAIPCILDYALAQGYQVLGLRDFLALAGTGEATLVHRKV